MIDIKITGTEMKNAFDRFISKSDMTEEKTSTLRFSQQKPPKLKEYRKKNEKKKNRLSQNREQLQKM